jgi:hypothetical protein
MSNSTTLISLAAHAATLSAKGCQKVVGPNGAFLVFTDAKGEKLVTVPVGKRSQDASLSEYQILVADDGGFIATANQYETVDTMSFS